MPHTSFPSPYLQQEEGRECVRMRMHIYMETAATKALNTRVWGGAALVSAEARLGDVVGDVGHAFHAASHDDVGLGSCSYTAQLLARVTR